VSQTASVLLSVKWLVFEPLIAIIPGRCCPIADNPSSPVWISCIFQPLDDYREIWFLEKAPIAVRDDLTVVNALYESTRTGAAVRKANADIRTESRFGRSGGVNDNTGMGGVRVGCESKIVSVVCHDPL
jgi:hypothetical protein